LRQVKAFWTWHSHKGANDSTMTLACSTTIPEIELAQDISYLYMIMKALENRTLPIYQEASPMLPTFHSLATIQFYSYIIMREKEIEFLCRINVPSAMYSKIEIHFCLL